MIMSKLKLYGLIALGAVLAVLGARATWIAKGVQKQQAREHEQRLEKMEDANEVRNEVEALDPDTLKQRAATWVRERHD